MIHERFSNNNRMNSWYQVPSTIHKSLHELKGLFADHQVVVWGNGHTVSDALVKAPWDEDAFHIGTNMAALLGVIDFSVYCVGDPRFMEQRNKRNMARTAPGVRVYQSTLKREMDDDETNFVETIGRDGFCSDLTKGVYHGYSVVWLALQVAVWTGTKDILLAGCPQDYSALLRFYDEKEPSPVDSFTHKIIANYTKLVPLLRRNGIKLRLIGKSVLEGAGLKRLC